MSDQRLKLLQTIRSAISRVTDAKAPEEVLGALESGGWIIVPADGIPVVMDRIEWEQVAYDLQFARTRTANRHAERIRAVLSALDQST